MSHEINEADGNIREIQRLRGLLALAEADNAALLAIARRANRVVTYNEAMEYVARLNADHPGAALLTELADLRGALASAQAELDHSQPIVLAAARLASGPDSENWEALYQALENAGKAKW